jgi:hypothetical protein
MTPRMLRARARVDLTTMAARLGLDARDLLDLERTPTQLWELRDLARYLAALGFVLAVAAIDPNGVRLDVV